MPPYLRLGSIPPQAAHRPPPRARASRARGSTTKKSSPSPGSAGPTASSTTCGRRRASARSSRPGRCRSSCVDAAGAAASSPQDAGDPARGRPDHRPGAAAGQRRRDRWRAAGPPSRRRSCTATPTPTRSSSSTRGRGTLHTMFGPLPFRAVRLRRHPALHDLPPRVRARLAARPARHRGDRQRRRSRRGTSTPTASSGSAPPTASATCTARARRSVDRPRARRRPVLDQGRPPADALHAGAPSVRRRRLGRHGLSVHVQRRRLRADHRHGPPAAAGASDVRGARVRRLHVRPADARHASRGDQGAVRPLQRAGRRGAVLRPRPVRQPPRRRGGVVHAAPARHPPRPAPRHHRRQPRR